MEPLSGQVAADNEVDDARFFALEEARALLTYPRDVEVLDLLGGAR
jgi:hypothetical protein